MACEHRVLLMQYGQVQARCSELVRAQAGEIERLQAQLMCLRAAVMVRDTAIAWRTPAAGEVICGDLRDKAVLCIGQDGEDCTVLEDSLIAADLVICQTGCISHDAYWRVQDHCKRTGKLCVMVEQPAALTVLRIHPFTVTSKDTT